MRNVVCVVILIAALAVGCSKKSGSSGVVAGASGTGVGISGTGVSGTISTGMSGMGGGTATIGGCEAADKSVTGSAAHAGALEVLNIESPCGFSSCHVPPTGKGMLVLKGVTDFHAALVGKMSCEANTIPLVDGRGGDAALQNSWLWIKLTAPASESGGTLTPQSTWPAAPGTCGQMSGFGTRMPQDFTATVLDMGGSRLAKIRNWICAGAPGP